MGDLLPGVVNAGNGWGGRISSGEKGTHRRFCDEAVAKKGRKREMVRGEAASTMVLLS